MHTHTHVSDCQSLNNDNNNNNNSKRKKQRDAQIKFATTTSELCTVTRVLTSQTGCKLLYNTLDAFLSVFSSMNHFRTSFYLTFERELNTLYNTLSITTDSTTCTDISHQTMRSEDLRHGIVQQL